MVHKKRLIPDFSDLKGFCLKCHTKISDDKLICSDCKAKIDREESLEQELEAF